MSMSTIKTKTFKSATAKCKRAMVALTGNAVSALNVIHEVLKRKGTMHIAGKAIHAVRLLDIGTHIRVARALGEAGTRDFVRIYPRLLFKYLSPYLAFSFSLQSRARILAYHYQSLAKVVSRDFLVRLYGKPVRLWELTSPQGGTVAIELTFLKDLCYEGDLSLMLYLDGALLAIASFTLVPGQEVGLTYDSALMIGRLQGQRQSSDNIARFKQICSGISPPNLLMTALQSMGYCLKAEALVGVSDNDQLTRAMVKKSEFHFSYDGFWRGYRSQVNANGVYPIQIPFERNALDTINPKRRLQTRRRRAFKDQIAQEMTANFEVQCIRFGDASG